MIRRRKKIKELKNPVKELKADAIKKDTCSDYLQKRSDELSSTLGKAMEEAIREFRASSMFADLLDKNYTTSFKDFCMDAIKSFLGVDFTPLSFPSRLKVLCSRIAWWM